MFLNNNLNVIKHFESVKLKRLKFTGAVKTAIEVAFFRKIFSDLIAVAYKVF